MLIEIKDDVFSIVKRIKNIDENYVVFYNTLRKIFELYSVVNFNKIYELNLGETLDYRTLKKIYESRICKINLLLKQIEENNERLNIKNLEKLKEESVNKLKLLISEVV